jgi:hypothetical protein
LREAGDEVVDGLALVSSAIMAKIGEPAGTSLKSLKMLWVKDVEATKTLLSRSTVSASVRFCPWCWIAAYWTIHILALVDVPPACLFVQRETKAAGLAALLPMAP